MFVMVKHGPGDARIPILVGSKMIDADWSSEPFGQARRVPGQGMTNHHYLSISEQVHLIRPGEESRCWLPQ
jgi:hypothetical protein